MGFRLSDENRRLIEELDRQCHTAQIAGMDLRLSADIVPALRALNRGVLALDEINRDGTATFEAMVADADKVTADLNRLIRRLWIASAAIFLATTGAVMVLS